MPETPSGAHGDSNGSLESIVHAGGDIPLPKLCAQIHERVEAFLSAESRDDRIKSVQAQSRISLDVIEEALEKYR